MAEETLSSLRTSAPRIVIREGGSVTVLHAENVDFVTAEGDYVSIRAEGHTYLKLETISAMADLLADGPVLNLDRLDRVETSETDAKEAVLKDGTRLAVSRSGYKTLMEKLS